MGFLKVLLIIIASFYLLGWIGRIMLKRYLRKVQKRMQEQQRNYYESRNPRPEGDVKVEFGKSKSKKFDKNQGDYIDYEEVR
ncbi:MAG: hypothetical protein A2W91_13460 [Bacteroidetes bacterium GWF2_38_335]|nr:MAG: hypothetical protein A2W91_13460 [Bacteroidetes bacterium GWF2_38_335]OFY77259.1 MAG: hypothetical protein A2281_15125 [Bacteroidetes bacterium RIFOXYA12_FULL_38_20]HBS85737.1 hypothetical protein [Bacteroidales bacterium]